MKKLLIIIICLIFITGCMPFDYFRTSKNVVKKDLNNPISFGIYEDVNNIYEGRSLTKIELKSDGTVLTEACFIESECVEYKGTYKITDVNLEIIYTEYYDYVEWAYLPNDGEKVSYDILGNNEFGNHNSKFVLK